MEDHNGNERNDIYSKKVRAGKRTYFFDVKATRSNDYYLTITESKRKPKDDGFYFEKHKLFLYKEDFFKFRDALLDTVEHINNELLDGYEPPLEKAENSEEIRDKSESKMDSDLKWD